MSEHEVLISAAHVAATCACGWTSPAVADYEAKCADSGEHMHEHYSVFVESDEDDGTRFMCWGVS